MRWAGLVIVSMEFETAKKLYIDEIKKMMQNVQNASVTIFIL